jgi:hypothetical protein
MSNTFSKIWTALYEIIVSNMPTFEFHKTLDDSLY